MWRMEHLWVTSFGVLSLWVLIVGARHKATFLREARVEWRSCGFEYDGVAGSVVQCGIRG